MPKLVFPPKPSPGNFNTVPTKKHISRAKVMGLQSPLLYLLAVHRRSQVGTMRFVFVLGVLFSVLVHATDPCRHGIQSVLAPLSDYGPARSFCSAKYPRTVTQSKNEKRSGDQTARTVRSSTKSLTSRQTASPVVTTQTSTQRQLSTTVKTPGQQASTNKQQAIGASLYPALLRQGANIVSTFCSCNVPPVTITVSDM